MRCGACINDIHSGISMSPPSGHVQRSQAVLHRGSQISTAGDECPEHTAVPCSRCAVQIGPAIWARAIGVETCAKKQAHGVGVSFFDCEVQARGSMIVADASVCSVVTHLVRPNLPKFAEFCRILSNFTFWVHIEKMDSILEWVGILYGMAIRFMFFVLWRGRKKRDVRNECGCKSGEEWKKRRSS